MRIRAALCTLAALMALPVASRAQVPVIIDTLRSGQFPERTSWENGYLSLFSMDREPQGGRSVAMGGTGIAAAGNAESHTLNPASILGLIRPSLSAEAKLMAGGVTADRVPARLDIGQGNFLDASDYRTRPRQGFTYHNLSFGMPVVMLGEKGALALSYRRVALTGRQDETRVELRGALTNQQDATFGIGDSPEEGLDAITLTAARQITPLIDVGVNANWQSGTISRSKEIGVAVLGFELFSGSTSVTQNVSGFNLDGGARAKLGPLTLGGTLLLGHDLKFKDGRARISPLPDPTAPNERLLILSEPHDHTQSVPNMLGLGASYKVGERLEVAADYWIRPWSKSDITRTRIEPFIGFADPADSSTYFFTLIPADNDSLWNAFSPFLNDPQNRQETFPAGLDNTNSLRLGLEYFLSKSPDFEFPVRIGFRKEKLTLSNMSLGAVTVSLADTTIVGYNELINAYWHALQDNDPDAAALGARLRDIAEYNQRLFRDDAVDATTISLGLGFRIQEFGADLTFERVSYTLERFFLQDFDPLINPVPATVSEKHSAVNIVLSTSMRF